MKHYKQIDGLRFVAIALVIIEHFSPLGKYISAGFYGVDLFFVISGFLITSILLKTTGSFGSIYKNFVGRRTLRIFPIYYLVIFVLYAIGDVDVRRYFIYLCTYTYNYAAVYHNVGENTISHIWSLCVEEQFYLFAPLLIIAFKDKPRYLKATFYAIVSICTMLLIVDIFPALTPFKYVSIIPRANSLGIGVLGAVYFSQNKLPKRLLENKMIEIFVFCLMIVLLSVQNEIGGKFRYALLPVVSLFLIYKAVTDNFKLQFIRNFLSNKSIVYIGSISYGIYLFHLPLYYYLTKYVFDPLVWDAIKDSDFKYKWQIWVVKMPVFSFISIVLAHFSFKYVETPILKLKDRWFNYSK